MIGFAKTPQAWVLILAMILSPLALAADEEFIILQSTTSTENSGLFEAILPVFEAETGIEVRVVAVGTGQAIRNASEGNGDVLLVHATSSEQAFVDAGHGIERFNVMFNDFVIVGPMDDPAKISGMSDATMALKQIAESKSVFVSRGDDSGTHKAELGLWEIEGIDAPSYSGKWYRETGSGMGTTLNIARELNAYTISDRATWISFARKGDHQVLVEEDPRLINQYGIIVVNPEQHPNVKAKEATRFVDWMIGPVGQSEIADFKLMDQQLFFPNATGSK